MIDILKLCRAVFLLFCLMIPGFIMKKAKLADDKTPLAFSNTVLYITQPALLFVGFFRPYDKEIMNGAVAVFVFTFVVHALFLLAVKLFSERRRRRPQRYTASEVSLPMQVIWEFRL